MNHQYQLFDRFKTALRSGAAAETFLLGHENGYSVYYVPFEYVNTQARLVLVGITPGPDQMKRAYVAAQNLLGIPAAPIDTLREIKRVCAFSGMRDRINEMLDHFGIPRRLGVDSASHLWNSAFDHLHATSIIPNAAFRNGAYFNGPFNAVLNTPLLRNQFETIFVPSLTRVNSKAFYIGMGPVVDAALNWCVSHGLLSKHQILGYFPHASGSSGSQFAYFMRRKRLDDLKPKDPVRHRARDLDAAYDRIASNVKMLCTNGGGAG